MKRQVQKTLTTESVIGRKLIRFLLVLCVVIVLLFTMLRSFYDVYEKATDVKYNLLAERFAASMQYAHRLWVTKNKPNAFIVEYFKDSAAINAKVGQALLLHINEFGWPINIGEGNSGLDCKNLWMYFAHEKQSTNEMSKVKAALSLTAQLEVDVKRINGNCHFLHKNKFPNQLMFSYHSGNGKVVTSYDVKGIASKSARKIKL